MNHFSVVAGEQNAVAESVRTSQAFCHIPLIPAIAEDSPTDFFIPTFSSCFVQDMVSQPQSGRAGKHCTSSHL